MSEKKSLQDLIKEYACQIEVLQADILAVKKEMRANPINNHMLSRKKVILEDMILDLKYSIALMSSHLN